MAIATLTVKLQAQIAEFQSEFREATRSTEKFQQEFQGIATKASAIGNLIAVGVQQIGGSLVGMAQKVVESASRIDDLSKKVGVSREAIQRWSFAAEQSGASIATVDRAVSFMNKTLAEGDKSTIAALERAGLSFQNIRNLKPEDAFNAIARAIAEIPDPMIRAQVAMQLFGRTGQDLLPGIVDGSFKAAEAIKVMSDETVKRLADAQDAWEKFGNTVTIHTGEVMGRAIGIFEGARKAIDLMTDSWKGFGQTIETVSVASLTGTTGLADLFDGMAADIERIKRAAPAIGTISFASRGAGPITGSNRPNQFGNVDLDAELKKIEDQTKKTQRATDQYLESVRALARELSGTRLQGDVKKLSDAFRTLTREQRQSDDVMNRVADAALDLFDAGAKLTPELFNIVIETGRLSDLLPPVQVGLGRTADAFKDVSGSVKASADELIEFLSVMNSIKAVEGVPTKLPGLEIPAPSIPEPLPPTFWQKFLDVRGPSFVQAARHAADSAIGALANAIVTGDWATFKASLRDTFTQFAGSAIAAGVNALVPGLGTLLQPLFTAFADKFVGLFDRNKGRDLVKDFASSLGGFAKLQERLNALGDEGRRLSELGTRIGRNNVRQAQEWIDQVNAAFERQTQTIKENQAAVTDLVQQHIGAGAQIPSALQASIDQLVEMGVVTRENAAEILGLTANVIKPSFADVTKAAEVLGVNIEAIGDSVTAIRFEEKALEAANAFATLEAAGADMGAVFAQSVEKIQPMVTEALRLGRELPEAMRPFLEQMVKAGLLTDEQGNKLEDLSRINFAEPLTKKLDDLIVKIGELIESITGGLGGALDKLSRRRVEVPIGFRVEAAPIPIDADIPALASGGIVRRPTLALVGESGPEAVVPLSSFGGPDTGSTTLIFETDGRVWAEIVAPHLPGVVRRYVPA